MTTAPQSRRPRTPKTPKPSEPAQSEGVSTLTGKDIAADPNPNNELIDHNYLEQDGYNTIEEILQRNLATSLGLYLKFKKFHWDIRGRMFRDLHKMYDDMAEAVFAQVDTIAERLVQQGGSPIAAPADIDRLSTAKVPRETIHDARAQLEALVADHDAICRSLRDDSENADEAGDPATADLLNAVIQTFDMHRWMLRATLDDKMLD